MLSFQEDQILVQECLRGNESAWSALIDKYKNLIFSIPIKRGLSRDNAADIFQSVCLLLLSELPHLREPRALTAWIIQTTFHKCVRYSKEIQRYVELDSQQEPATSISGEMPDELLIELEREQMVREAVAVLSSECKRLIDALFYHAPPASYDSVATALDMPKGSIGPIRMRCLDRVRRLLKQKGF
jgi:RNA polymerase sigma factor (sigma-70 family)